LDISRRSLQRSITFRRCHRDLDGDLQDPPESIPALVAKFLEGYDVVYAQRTRRKEGILLKLAFFVFYRLMKSLSDTRYLWMRAILAWCREGWYNFCAACRSITAIFAGCAAGGLPPDRHPIERSERFAGESKYGVLKYLKLASDAIFFLFHDSNPRRCAAGICFGFFFRAFCFLSVIAKIFFHQPPKASRIASDSHVSRWYATFLSWNHRRVRKVGYMRRSGETFVYR